MSKLNELKNYIVIGKMKLVAGAAQECLDEGIPAVEILNTMIDGMGEVGEKFRKNEIYVPEMLVAAKSMKKGVEVIKPHLASGEAGANGKVIIGTVAGDLHDIGKNLVAMMIEAAGFEVIDLGVDVPAEKFVEAYKENPDVKIIALSALLTSTMAAMEEAVGLLKQQEFAKDIKIMVGGAPISTEFAAEIGADAYTPDAGSAAEKAKEIAG